jgi:hypothetical protein
MCYMELRYLNYKFKYMKITILLASDTNAKFRTVDIFVVFG